MMIQLKTKKELIFFFQIYVPDSSYNADQKEKYYVTMQQEPNTMPRKSKLIVMGDVSEKTRKERWINWPRKVGKFTTGMMNENGEKIIQFCSNNDLSIMSTMCNHPPKRLYTWSSPDGNPNQIDFAIATKEYWGSIKNCRVYNSADIYSNHSLSNHSLLAPKYLTNMPKRKFPTRVIWNYDMTKLNNKVSAT